MWGRITAAYRWRRTLASCRLDPERLARPAPPPEEGDFIIAGCPRSGTSLLAAMLFQPPDVVTVMEPWDGLRLPPRELFTSLREEIADGRLKRGRLDVDALASGKVRWQQDRSVSYPISVRDGFKLGVKWPTFWQLLELLPDTRFLITVRHPVEVVTSFQRVGGRLAEGLDYDVTFNARMNRELEHATRDHAERRVLLYQYINSRIIRHFDRDNVLVVRYERWFEDPRALMKDISEFLDIPPIEPTVRVERPKQVNPPAEVVSLIQRLAPVHEDLGYEL